MNFIYVILALMHCAVSDSPSENPRMYEPPAKEEITFVNCAHEYTPELQMKSCIRCLPTYFPITDEICISKDPFCWLFRVSDKECVKCMAGFTLKSPENYCTPDFGSCKEHDKDKEKCILCLPGSVLANGGCSSQAN